MTDPAVEMYAAWLRATSVEHAAAAADDAVDDDTTDDATTSAGLLAELREDPGRVVRVGQTLVAAADRCRHDGDPRAAELGWRQAIAIIDAIDPDPALSPAERAWADRTAAMAHRRLAEHDLMNDRRIRAEEHAARAASLFQRAGRPVEGLECDRVVALVARAERRLDRARRLLQRALQQASTLPNADWVRGLCTRDLGDLWLAIGDHPAAIGAADTAHRLLAGHPQEQARCDELRAAACRQSDQHGAPAALECADRDLQAALDAGQAGDFDRACLDAAWAALLVGEGEIDSAADRFTGAVDTFRHIGARLEAAQCLLEQADIFNRQAQYVKAANTFREAGHYFRSRADVVQAAVSDHGQAKALIGQAQQLDPESPEEPVVTRQAFDLAVQALAALHGVSHRLPDHRAREQWRRAIGAAYCLAFRIAAQGLEDAVKVAQLVEICTVTGAYELSLEEQDSTSMAGLVTDGTAADRARVEPSGWAGLALAPPPSLWWTPGVDLPWPGEQGQENRLPTW